MNPSKKGQGPGGIALVEEVVSLVRRLPFTVLATYYIGTMPFVAGLIAFWATMLQSPFGERFLPLGALVMALLFLWMKVWQARYARLVAARIRGTKPRRWTAGKILRSVAVQGLFHATGWIVLPMAALALAPLGWVYATYQNATALDDGHYGSARALLRDASEQAKLWPAQNHILLWLLSPFLVLFVGAFYLALIPVITATSPVLIEPMAWIYAVLLVIILFPLSPSAMVIAVNIATGFLLGIMLLESFLGIHTVFGASSGAVDNSTFTAAVLGLVYLVMDPVLKAAYVLRCFYGLSLNTGEDLKLSLNSIRRKAVPLLLIAALGILATESAHAEAAKPTVDPQALDAALEQELTEWQYTWRMPRPVTEEEDGLVAGTLRGLSKSMRDTWKDVGDWIQSWLDWFFDRDSASYPTEAGALASIKNLLRFLLVALSIALAVLAAVVAVRVWKRRTLVQAELDALAAPVLPDLEDEDTTADELPEEGWLVMASELLAKGQLRLAIRALFLATLARLAEQELVRIARFKSNWDYHRELARYDHARPGLKKTFDESAAAYEAVWYGDHEATPQRIGLLQRNQESLGNRVPE